LLHRLSIFLRPGLGIVLLLLALRLLPLAFLRLSLLLALLLGAIMVMNTTLMTVLERQSEFALLVAVGWPGWQIARLVIGQALLLGLLGASLGLPLGLLAAELAPRLLGVSALVDPSVSIGALALALGVALSTGVLGSLYPAWRVTRLQPAAALG